MRKLIKGLIEFQKNLRPERRETLAKLALGQKPDALLISCCDSRVAVEMFASTEPGDIFTHRNVGNLVPLAGSNDACATGSAIEFAVLTLKVRDIIVCGHSECGATQAMLSPSTVATPHLRKWLKNGAESTTLYREGFAPNRTLQPHNQVSQINALTQLQNLLSYPFVKERVEKGELGLHAWWFDISNVEVSCYDREKKQFVVIKETADDERNEVYETDFVKPPSESPAPLPLLTH